MIISKEDIKKLIKEELSTYVESDPVEEKYEPEEDKHNREGSMARSQLFKLAKYSAELINMFEDTTDLPEWVEAKITKASDYLGMVKHYIEGEMARQQAILEEKPADLEN